MIFAALLAAAVVPAGQTFQCTPVAVWDGDGPIWCKEGQHVRLSGISAREMDGSCSPNHPCPDVDPIASRDYLASLIGRITGTLRTGHLAIDGPALKCVSAGGAGGSRTAAFCVSPLVGDLSCTMVRSGYAVRWDRYWKAHSCE